MPHRGKEIFAASSGHAPGVEEISIGALARRRRLRRVAAGAFGAGLIVLAGAVYWALRPCAEFSRASGYPAKVRCRACGFEGTMVLQPGQGSPVACRECRARAAWIVWRCLDCGGEFVPDPNSSDPNCPLCHRSARIGSAAAR